MSSQEHSTPESWVFLWINLKGQKKNVHKTDSLTDLTFWKTGDICPEKCTLESLKGFSEIQPVFLHVVFSFQQIRIHCRCFFGYCINYIFYYLLNYLSLKTLKKKAF